MTAAGLFNLECEQALLGALLINNEGLAHIPQSLSPGDFGEPVHARIFETAATMIRSGRTASPVTLKTYFERDETLKEIGGPAYLARLAAAATTIINISEYGRVIGDLALRRRAVAHIREAATELENLPIDVTGEQSIADLAHDLTTMGEASGNSTRTTFVAGAVMSAAIDEAASAYQNHGKRTDAISTGIVALDEKIGGLIRGDFVIIGGRPSMGKTALGLVLLHNTALAGVPGMFISLEMRAAQLGHRLLALRSGIEYRRIAWGKFDEIHFNILIEAAKLIESMPFTIEDRAGMTTPALSAAVARSKTKHPKLGLVVVDYLSLIVPGDRYRGRKVDELAEISAECKRLAKQYDVAFVALQQLSRSLETRENKRPTLADLRDSGAIEQDADIVLFPFRDGYYIARDLDALHPEDIDAIELSDRLRKVAFDLEVIVAKNRQGSTGTVRLYADVATNVIRDHHDGGAQ